MVGLVAVALAVAVVVVPRLDPSHPVASAARLLVPSWRFFDAVNAPPALSARLAGADGEFGPWHAVLPAPERAWWNVAWHPHGNLSFATHSLLFRLRDDLAWTDAAPASTVSYGLVLDLVRWSVRDAEPAATHVQFRLTAEHELLVSEVHDR